MKTPPDDNPDALKEEWTLAEETKWVDRETWNDWSVKDWN